jgi:cell division protein FtsL
VQSTHESRRVFSALDKAKKDEQQLAAEYKRLDAERQAQATHRLVQQVAKDKLRMRSATPDVMAYVVDPGASALPGARHDEPPPRARPANNSVRSVNYATSPLLASKTPPWRSRFVVVLVGAAFAVLLGRAVHLQIWATDFYQAEGEKRFVHKEPLPASRGRILDRHGLVLATSVALPTVQVEARNFVADAPQRQALAKALGMPVAELDRQARRRHRHRHACAGWWKSRCGSRSRRWA